MMTARNAICRTSMSLLSNPVPRTDRKKSSNECSPTHSLICNPGAEDGIVPAQSGPLEGAMCNFRAHLIEKLADVRFSNRPVGVKHFQTIHHCSVDVAHGLAILFGIGTKALPLWDSRTRRNNLWVGLAVTPTGRSNRTYELTSSIVPRRTSFHGLAELEYSPIVIDPAWLLCRRDLPGPTELSAINPYAVHDHGQPARQGPIAFFIPRRLAICIAQALSHDHFFERSML